MSTTRRAATGSAEPRPVHKPSPRRQPTPGPEIWSEIRSTVVIGSIVTSIVVLVTIMIAVVWPQISLLMSSAKPVVDALYSSSIYVGPGVDHRGGTGDVDAAEIAGIVGTRPIATVLLAGDDPLAEHPLDVCRTVVDHLDTLVVQVIVDGSFQSGCEGDGVHYGSDTDPYGWDFVFWYRYDSSTSLVAGDVSELVRQLALNYDAEVAGGRLIASERSFAAPPSQVWTAVSLVGGVVVGTIALYLLLAFGARRACGIYDRRRAWDNQRDDIDSELGNVAMMMVAQDPTADLRLIDAIADVAPEYRRALDDFAAARPGTDLEELASRVGAIRDQLTDTPVGT
ncbi:MAG: hypothetical protein ABI382_02570 [Nakamurella sp.]